MIIITASIVAFVVFLLVWYFNRDSSTDWVIGTIVSGIVLGGVLLTWGAVQLGMNGQVRQFQAVQATVAQARQNKDITAIELAALQQKIVEMNQWLADAQYYASNPLTNWFVPTSVLELKPLR